MGAVITISDRVGINVDESLIRKLKLLESLVMAKMNETTSANQNSE